MRRRRETRLEQSNLRAGSDREVNSALYAATNQLAKLIHQLHQLQPENPGVARMMEDFGHAEKGTFMGHGDDWQGEECIRQHHKYAHYHPPESEYGDDDHDDQQGDQDWYGNGYEDGGYENGDGGDQYDTGDGYDYSNGYGGEGHGDFGGGGEAQHDDGTGFSHDQGYGQDYDQGHSHAYGQGQDQDQYQPDEGHYSQHDNMYG